MLLRSGLARNMAGAGLSGAIGHYDITKLNAMSAEPIAHLSLWPARPPGAIIAIVHCFAFPWPSQLLDGSQPFGRSTPGFAERRHFQYAEALGACEWTVDGRPPPAPPPAAAAACPTSAGGYSAAARCPAADGICSNTLSACHCTVGEPCSRTPASNVPGQQWRPQAHAASSR